MGNVNCWLLGLSFLLGLVITLAFMIRRVKREVPEYGSGSGAARLTGGATGAAGAAARKGAASAEDAEGRGVTEPYGAGSLRGATAPSGWTIKGNEDSMLYHTTDSPSYQRTIAEVWFRDEDTARKAGFTHWKEG